MKNFVLKYIYYLYIIITLFLLVVFSPKLNLKCKISIFFQSLPYKKEPWRSWCSKHSTNLFKKRKTHYRVIWRCNCDWRKHLWIFLFTFFPILKKTTYRLYSYKLLLNAKRNLFLGCHFTLLLFCYASCCLYCTYNVSKILES